MIYRGVIGMKKRVMYRHNVIQINSIDAFFNMRGGISGNMRDVCFVRLVGENSSFAGELAKAESRAGNRTDNRAFFYTRVNHLPVWRRPEESEQYALLYDRWKAGGSEALRVLSHADGFSQVLSDALTDTTDLFRREKPSATESIIRNFGIKLLFWMGSLLKGELENWNERSCIKVAAQNVVKVQEYLFFYFLTLIGCDVLLIQNKQDVEAGTLLMQLSHAIRLGSFGTTELSEYVPDFSGQTAGGNGAGVSGGCQNNEKGQNGRIRVVLPERKRNKGSAKQAASPSALLSQPAGSAVTTQPADHSALTRPARNPVPAKPADHPVLTQTGRANRGGAPDTGREKSFEELARLASSIVMISVHDTKGDVRGTGSGIMIGEGGYILTNFHVVSHGRFYSVRMEEDENIYQTDELIKYHDTLDLAVLRIDKRLTPLPVYKGGAKLVRGQKVVAIGSPLGLFNSVSDGIISGFRTIDGVNMIQFTAPTSPGSSGGAVLNMQGEVIGISTAGIDSGQNINLAVGYENILMFARGFY